MARPEAKEILKVQHEGDREIARKLKFYNLDAVISVGYRINSAKTTQLRIWATQIIRVGGESVALMRWPWNAKLLIDAGDEVAGLRIYGTPRMPHINGVWAFEASPLGEELDRAFEAIPENLDVLLTHSPPLIRHQKVDVPIDNNSPHFGSFELKKALGRAKPRYALCGHMVKHVILLKLKDDIADKANVKAGIKSGLEGLKGVVPGLVDIVVRTEGLVSSNADVMLDSTFESESSLKGYSIHPAASLPYCT